MTYGWALLIILVVGAVLFYYGVFTPGRLVGTSIVGFSDEKPIRSVYTSAGTLTMNVENRCGETATLLRLIDVSDNVIMDITDVTVAAGSRVTVSGSTGVTASTGDAFNVNLAIEYTCASITANSTGTLSGTRS